MKDIQIEREKFLIKRLQPVCNVSVSENRSRCERLAAHCRTEGAQHRLLDRTRVIFVTYRPLEVKRHPDGRALGDGVGVGAEDLSERGAVGARRLRVDDVLGMLETHAEKNLAIRGGGATDTAGAGEGVDLQLEDPGGEGLRGEEKVLHRISDDARK